MINEVRKYIEKRYQRWLDYSTWHCCNAGMQGQECDVLNEVMLSLLNKSEQKLNSLYETKKGQYRELDFFVLRMLKLNIYSPLSPYRYKNKPICKNCNIKLENIDIEDAEYDESDNPQMILNKFRLIETTLESLNLSDYAKRVFRFKFIQGQALCEWNGPEPLDELYRTYNKVKKILRDKIKGKLLI